MVRIRLRRVGRKKQPSYRVVVADVRSPRDGRYIEVIGFYNPRTQPATMTLKEDRALYWLQNGAQPSDPVRRIMDKLGTLARLERLHQGEALEALVKEAEDEAAAREPISPKTSYPAQKKVAKPVAEVEPVKEAAPIAEVEPVKEAAPVAEVEAVEEAAPVAEVEAVEEAAPVAEVEAAEEAEPEATDEAGTVDETKPAEAE